MTTPLPPTFQALLGQRQHNTGLRQPAERQLSPDLIKYGDLVQAEHAAWQEKNPGLNPSKADTLEMVRRAQGVYEKLPVPGSLGERKLGADVGVAEAEAKARPEKLAAELDKTSSEKANLDQTREQEKLLAPFKVAKLLADIELARTQSSHIGMKAALSDLLGQVHEARAGLAWAAKAGVVDSETAAKLFAEQYNKLSSQFDVIANERSWAQKYVPGLKEPLTTIQPRGGVPPPQSQASPEPRPQESAPPTEQFKGAPAGKKPGDVLKSGGRPVARWDGQRWIPLEGQ
jgi:hypothetical protein